MEDVAKIASLQHVSQARLEWYFLVSASLPLPAVLCTYIMNLRPPQAIDQVPYGKVELEECIRENELIRTENNKRHVKSITLLEHQVCAARLGLA